MQHHHSWQHLLLLSQILCVLPRMKIVNVHVAVILTSSCNNSKRFHIDTYSYNFLTHCQMDENPCSNESNQKSIMGINNELIVIYNT